MAKAKSQAGRTTSRGGAGRRAESRTEPPATPEGERELIVVTSTEAGLRTTAAGLTSVAEAGVSSLNDVLAAQGATMRPLFGANEDRLRSEALEFALAAEVPVTGLPDLSVFYKVEAPDERLDELASELHKHESVVAAYVKPPAALARAVATDLNDMLPAADEPPATADFTGRQGYLDAAPGGIDARFAWTVPGGSGAGVRVIDIEGAWRFTHEDLLQNQGGVVGGTQSTDVGWRNHGTAVVGEISGDRNGFGITGICPDANMRAISIFGGTGSAGAIRQAATMLSAGDIILIELHRAGPRHNFQPRGDQAGYICIYWWPDDKAAIDFALSRGVLVVAAAGNGSENLDDPIYNNPAPGFPTTWANPFLAANRNPGLIIVGAGAPPPGTHGRNIHGPDRCRLNFSNWGSTVDAQGWGREVTTTGYGDLQGGSSEDLWYTDQFSGTSSASPIVVGALGCVQGILRARGVATLTPARARNLLRSTGSPQQDGPAGPATQRIGNRPNLRQMIQRATKGVLKEKVEVKDGVKDGLKDSGKDKLEVKDQIKDGIKDQIKEQNKEKLEIKEKVEKREVEGKNQIFDRKVRDFIGVDPVGEPTMDMMGDPMTLLNMLLERVSNLEAQLASGSAFINPEERPNVGETTLDNS